MRGWQGRLGFVAITMLALSFSPGVGLARDRGTETPAAAGRDGTDAIRRAVEQAGATLISLERSRLVDDVFEYTAEVGVGPGPFDRIGVHRVVKEERPFIPIVAHKAVLMLHGDSSNFRTAFLSTESDEVPSDHSLGVFLAQAGVDVWGVDLRWTFVPDTTSDFSFMRTWDTALHLRDIRLGVRVARVTRRLTRSGFGKIFMLGHSRGAQFVYAYADAETQLPPGHRDLRGIIPVDAPYKFSPQATDEQGRSLIQLACERFADFQDQFDNGVFVDGSGFAAKAIAEAAANDPDGPSGFGTLTNRQFALLVLASTFLTFQAPQSPPVPFYHYFAGTFDEATGLPTDLAFTSFDFVLDFARAVPGFQSRGEIKDGEAIWCGSPDLPFDDHLGEITIPVLYVGAEGGFGSFGVFATTLLGSQDVTTLQVSFFPPELRALDYGHVDLLLADNARALVWAPIASWVRSH